MSSASAPTPSPPSVRNSRALTGNHLGQLGNVHQLLLIDPAYDDAHLRQIFQYYSLNPDEMEKEIHRYPSSLLDQGLVQQAWQLLLMQAYALLLKALGEYGFPYCKAAAG
ncbi:MAG: hypothetical protein ACK4E0_19050 [Chitinophagaceae bacterium]